MTRTVACSCVLLRRGDRAGATAITLSDGEDAARETTSSYFASARATRSREMTTAAHYALERTARDPCFIQLP